MKNKNRHIQLEDPYTYDKGVAQQYTWSQIEHVAAEMVPAQDRDNWLGDARHAWKTRDVDTLSKMILGGR